jgi:hypothetical protein
VNRSLTGTYRAPPERANRLDVPDAEPISIMLKERALRLRLHPRAEIRALVTDLGASTEPSGLQSKILAGEPV